MRRYFIAGNWKMNLLQDEARALARGVSHGVGSAGHRNVRVAVAPTFLSIAAVRDSLGSGTAVALAAQNCHEKDKGAFTGEVSAAICKDAGCAYVILGHSERRQFFHETDQLVRAKRDAVLAAGIQPIICIGETKQQREMNETMRVVEGQLTGGLEGLSAGDAGSKLTIAYEPVWAIGTGLTATPQQAQEVHAFIRSWLVSHYGKDVAKNVAIQYGGSVNDKNAKELLSQPDIDGALVGGASLKADSFLAIVNAAVSLAV